MNLLSRVRYALWFVVKKIELQLTPWLLRKSCMGHIDGVAICDIRIVQDSPDRFLKTTRTAMALIKEIDPRRYRRICRQFDYIVNRELVEAGNFEQELKICNIDDSKFLQLSDPTRQIRSYAIILIHEATHGVIARKGILYDKDRQLRIERLCHMEGYRFARRFEPGFADAFAGPFNPDIWKLAWGPKQHRTAASWKRLRESLEVRFFKRAK